MCPAEGGIRKVRRQGSYERMGPSHLNSAVSHEPLSPKFEGPEDDAVQLRFGVFDLNIRTRELRKSGSRVRLQEQPFRVLAVLLERPGDMVTREELRRRLWGDSEFGDFDQAINVAVKKLRLALGDDADNPRFIETLPRRGYRFIAPVTGLQSSTPAFTAAEPGPPLAESPL